MATEAQFVAMVLPETEIFSEIAFADKEASVAKTSNIKRCLSDKKLEYKNQLTTTKKRATRNELHASLLL